MSDEPNPTVPVPASSPTPPPLPPDPSRPLPPIAGPGAAISAVLRHPLHVVNHFHHHASPALALTLLMVAIVSGVVYGLVLGTFTGGTQLWAAPLKVAGGFLLSMLICLPSLYVFSCLAGSEVKGSEMCGLAAGVLALMNLLLIGFAPVAWIFSQSTNSLLVIGAMHFFFWVIAARFGLRFLNLAFGILGDKSNGLKIWALIFVVVMLQMMTTLRPMVGTASTLLPTEKKFFITHWVEQFQGARAGTQAAAGID